MTRLSRNILYNLVGQSVVLLASFVAVRLIFRQLGADAFGIIYFNLSLATVLNTSLELGVTSTTVREVAAHVQADRQYVINLIRTASLLFWSIGLVLLVGLFLATPVVVERWIHLKSLDQQSAIAMVRILSIGTAVGLPKALYASIFRGLQRMEISNGVEVATYAAQQLGTVGLLAVGAPVFAVVGWISASAVAGTLVFMVMTARSLSWSALVPKYFSHIVARNLRFTGRMTTISITSMIYTQTDKLIVSKLLPIADFGLYGFASATVVRASTITNAISGAAYPSFSALFKDGDADAVASQYRKLQDAVCYGTLPVFAGICFAALPIYTFLFGTHAATVLLVPTVWLSVGTYMNGTLAIPYVLSLAVGRPDIASRANVLALFVVVPTTALLIYFFGLPGAGASWVFYHLFLYAFMVPPIARQCIGVGAGSWFAHLMRPVAAAVVCYALTWELIAVPLGSTFFSLVVAYLVATAGFGIAAFFAIGRELRATLQRGLTRTLQWSRRGT